MAAFTLWTVTPLVTDIITTLVLVAVGEELFFRGTVQTLLDRAWGTPWRVFGARVGWGWIVQAVLFGAAHPLVAGDPALIGWGLWTACAGLVFGWLRARSGTIWAPALVHGVLNAVGLVVLPGITG